MFGGNISILNSGKRMLVKGGRFDPPRLSVE